ncbi:MAG: DMT family transporter [Anaerolineae bacterium]|nr:DMT family transporter [Anaerolineae bacterium]
MQTTKNLRGVSFLALAMLIFSLQDIAVKWIGGDYPILEIVIFRSIIAMPCTLLFFYFEGQRGLPTTKHHKLEYVRGIFLFLSYTTHFMGLAALPLAEIASIRFSGPMMITFLSVIWLGEKVNTQRWLALIIGFFGVLLIVRPGSASFNMGSIFILLSTLFYALSVMVTRQLRTVDSSATMAYYSSLVYLVAAFILAPLATIIGTTPDTHSSLAFLFRAWSIPSIFDLIVMSGLGLVWASGMYFIARAYSSALASVVAPFEYITLPINVMWGFIIWREVPTLLTWVGALLTLLSGLYSLRQEQKP